MHFGLERLGSSKSLVGLVVLAGYIFNTDGTSIFMALAALFVAQATNMPWRLMQQLTKIRGRGAPFQGNQRPWQG